MKVLLVGKGAREHALAWKLSQSPRVEHVYVVPGNGGTSQLASVSNIQSVDMNDYTGLATLAKDLEVGLVVAGPDDVVVGGIEAYFRDSNFDFDKSPSMKTTGLIQKHCRRDSLLCSHKRSGRD